MKKFTTLLLTLVILISALSIDINAAEYSGSVFVDISVQSWYYESCTYCYENQLMKGVGDGVFLPLGKVTREQFVQALANIDSADLTSYAEAAVNTPFKDVKADAWYSNAIEWARANGIVTGISSTVFG